MSTTLVPMGTLPPRYVTHHANHYTSQPPSIPPDRLYSSTPYPYLLVKCPSNSRCLILTLKPLCLSPLTIISAIVTLLSIPATHHNSAYKSGLSPGYQRYMARVRSASPRQTHSCAQGTAITRRWSAVSRPHMASQARWEGGSTLIQFRLRMMGEGGVGGECQLAP